MGETEDLVQQVGYIIYFECIHLPTIYSTDSIIIIIINDITGADGRIGIPGYRGNVGPRGETGRQGPDGAIGNTGEPG